MKEKVISLLLFTSCCFALEQPQEFSNFISEIFSILEECSKSKNAQDLEKVCDSSARRLHTYEVNTQHPELATLAKEFIVSLKKETTSKGCLGDAVSSFGRFLKSCVSNGSPEADLPFFLEESEVKKQLQLMEAHLADRLPKKSNINFHQLMIESIADQNYDIALYAYFKIAEMRSQKL